MDWNTCIRAARPRSPPERGEDGDFHLEFLWQEVEIQLPIAGPPRSRHAVPALRSCFHGRVLLLHRELGIVPLRGAIGNERERHHDGCDRVRSS